MAVYMPLPIPSTRSRLLPLPDLGEQNEQKQINNDSGASCRANLGSDFVQVSTTRTALELLSQKKTYSQAIVVWVIRMTFGLCIRHAKHCPWIC